jgi:hypothetical protein
VVAVIGAVVAFVAAGGVVVVSDPPHPLQAPKIRGKATANAHQTYDRIQSSSVAGGPPVSRVAT